MAVATQLRRKGEPVLRNSVDHRHPDATRKRTFGSGTKSDHEIRTRAFVRTVGLFNAASIGDRKGYQGDLGHTAEEIAFLILNRLNLGLNVCDSTLSQLEADSAKLGSGLRRDAIMAGRDKLVDAGFLGVLRRSAPTGLPKEFGLQQRAQISNLTFPTMEERLRRNHPEWYDRYLELFKLYKDERREAARQWREAEGRKGTRQQRAERRQARRREVLAAKPPRKLSAGSEGVPLAKLNPSAAAAIKDGLRAVEARARRGELLIAPTQAQTTDLERVEANLESLMAEMRRQCGNQASRT